MKIFLDSATLSEIQEAVSFGTLDGCTTNPSLIARAGGRLEEIIPAICALVEGPVSAEVLSTEAEAMVIEGRRLAALHPQVVVKIPLIPEGLKAVRALTEEGIHTNVTLCFSATQALLAAKAGATYISPFVGRLDDLSVIGMELIEQIGTIYDNYGFNTQILVASVRSTVHVMEAALLGAHCITLPFSVLQQLIKHPLTDLGVDKFLHDAKSFVE